MYDTNAPAADALCIFGITGDLAHKMTFRALYRLEHAGLLTCPVIGVAMESWSDDQLRGTARTAVQATEKQMDEGAMSRLEKRLSYLQGDFSDPATYEKVASKLKGTSHPLFYLEIPPSLFASVVQNLGKAGLTSHARVLIEKPFGHDLASARALDEQLHAEINEDQILRIDHFLGKQPVLDVQYLRFANALFEPVWNRDHIAEVQVTLAESFGVDDRGAFYDSVGALRDVVQNHLLQVIALIAMEAPAGTDYRALWDKRVDVFRAMAEADPNKSVRGQYEGYESIKGVHPNSQTETYVALRLEIDNQRWAGVPFFIRAGKALAATSTEVRVIFKRPPRLAFLEEPSHRASNQMILRIDPDPGLRIIMQSKGADGRGCKDVHMDLGFEQELGKPPEPYERLLHDALGGQHALFTPEDAVEQTWRILQPLLDKPPDLKRYARGSWGPAEANHLLRGHVPWQLPWV